MENRERARCRMRFLSGPEVKTLYGPALHSWNLEPEGTAHEHPFGEGPIGMEAAGEPIRIRNPSTIGLVRAGTERASTDEARGHGAGVSERRSGLEGHRCAGRGMHQPETTGVEA